MIPANGVPPKRARKRTPAQSRRRRRRARARRQRRSHQRYPSPNLRQNVETISGPPSPFRKRTRRRKRRGLLMSRGRTKPGNQTIPQMGRAGTPRTPTKMATRAKPKTSSVSIRRPIRRLDVTRWTTMSSSVRGALARMRRKRTGTDKRRLSRTLLRSRLQT